MDEELEVEDSEKDEHLSSGESDEGEGGTEGDLLSEFRDRYADEDGPELKKELADIANTIWRKGRDPTVLKDVLQSYPRPRNVACHKVDINPEVLMGLPKQSKSKDLSLRAAQSSVARTCVPPLRMAEALLSNKETPKKDVMKMTMDTLTLLSEVNDTINQIRRETLKPALMAKFQGICKT